MDKGLRLLLFSLRNIKLHVAQCAIYEAEDLIASFHDADILAPKPSSSTNRNLLTSGLKRILRLNEPLIDGPLRVEKDYDLFFMVCHSPYDLQYLELIQDLDRCRISICLVREFWPSIHLSKDHIRVLQRFDFVFSILECGVETIEKATGRSCHYLAWGIDAVEFCPHPQPARHINVYSMGRTIPETHEALLAIREQDRLFYYLHDTICDFRVDVPGEHRRQVINCIQRSQYFITYPARYDQPEVTQRNDEIGVRFFEGAAGGSIMIGMPPACKTFQEYFDWPDAVIPIDEHISAFMARLDREPHRLARIRKDNVINSLERHDWVYRWHDILNGIGVGPTPAMIQRTTNLQTLANLVSAAHVLSDTR